MKNYAEPWGSDEVVRDNESVIRLRSKTGGIVARLFLDVDDERFNEEQRAYARRIKACVNACCGLPTDELEQKGLVAAVGTQLLDADDRAEGQEREIRKLARITADAENKLADALNERDKLQAALQLARDMFVANDLILPHTFEVIRPCCSPALRQ